MADTTRHLLADAAPEAAAPEAAAALLTDEATSLVTRASRPLATDLTPEAEKHVCAH